MNVQQSVTAIGGGVSTFLLVVVFVIELLEFEFSAIIGLPVGLLAGLAVLVALVLRFDDIGHVGQVVASAYGAFGTSSRR